MCARAQVRRCAATTAEVRALVGDLQVLGRTEFKALLKFRAAVRKALGEDLGLSDKKKKEQEEEEQEGEQGRLRGDSAILRAEQCCAVWCELSWVANACNCCALLGGSLLHR